MATQKKGGATSAPEAAETPEPKQAENKQPEAKQAEPTQAGPKQAEAEATRVYHVVGPGSIMRTVIEQVDGKTRKQTTRYRAGELIELTDEEAQGYGGAIALGKPKPPPAPVEKRKAGKYRAVGPGKVLHGKKFHTKGAVLELSAKDAQSLGTIVEEA